MYCNGYNFNQFVVWTVTVEFWLWEEFSSAQPAWQVGAESEGKSAPGTVGDLAMDVIRFNDILSIFQKLPFCTT